MFIITLSKKINSAVAEYAQAKNIDLGVKIEENIAHYTLGNTLTISQSSKYLTIEDDNWPQPLVFIRDFVMINDMAVGFMHAQDGINILIFPSKEETTKSMLEAYKVNIDSSIENFIANVNYIFDEPEDEGEEDAHSTAMEWAESQAEKYFSSEKIDGSYINSYKIMFGFTEPKIAFDQNEIDGPYFQTRTFHDKDERIDALVGRDFYLILEFDETTHPPVAWGEIHIFYDGDNQANLDREEIIEMAKPLHNNTVDRVLIDADDAFYDESNDGGLWLTAIETKNDRVIVEPFFWESGNE